MTPLLILAALGLAMLWLAPEGSVWAEIGAVTALASILAIPVGFALGTF